MKYLLKVLEISGEDIASHAGVTRQAVSQGSSRAEQSARVLVNAARLSPEQMGKVIAAYQELTNFLNNEV